MRYDLPRQIYITHDFFLSVGDNLKIFLKPCTQEEKFEVKYCFNYMWHHNFSKFVSETGSGPPPPTFATLLLGPINIYKFYNISSAPQDL